MGNPHQLTLLVLLSLASIGPAAGCATGTPRRVLAMNPQTLEFRARSTRRFSTTDEGSILAAAAGLLQDLGFAIDNSESDLGLVVGSKDRPAVEGGQVFGKVVYGLLFRADLPIDKVQRFRASLVTRPIADAIAVRVTFQRIVWNDRGQISKLELIDDPKLYQEFFDKLSQAVFLEAHKP